MLWFECTSNWYWLCDLLRSLGIIVVLAHAKYVKAISYAKVKTDAIDARTLAQLLRMGFVPEAHQLPPEYRAMRDLLRQRMVMEHKRTNLVIRITSIPAKLNITDLSVGPSQSGFADFLGDEPKPGKVFGTASHVFPSLKDVSRWSVQAWTVARLNANGGQAVN